ncbi:MAG: molecular chaperone DnaK [Pirellulaceae bacterium]|nr:MAG: molecular chaperone DnaK [Pirellulaceae bacterium]
MKRTEFLKRVEQRLRKRRQELIAAMSGELKELRLTNDRLVGDMADLAVEEDYGQVNANLAEVASEELRLIDRALERMAAGTYGICEDCGKAIPMARLEALPFAVQCLRCRQQAERESATPSRTVEHWSRLSLPEDDDESIESEPDFNSVASELAA